VLVLKGSEVYIKKIFVINLPNKDYILSSHTC